MSNVLIVLSTPATATTDGRYLFQSWVSASDGGHAAGGAPGFPGIGEAGAAWMGIWRVRWFDAEAGVRRSYTRRYESEETQERISGECGEKEALYVQLCVGRVTSECGRCGDQMRTVPSQLLEQKVSFATRFQDTLNTSRLCSFQF